MKIQTKKNQRLRSRPAFLWHLPSFNQTGWRSRSVSFDVIKSFGLSSTPSFWVAWPGHLAKPLYQLFGCSLWARLLCVHGVVKKFLDWIVHVSGTIYLQTLEECRIESSKRTYEVSCLYNYAYRSCSIFCEDCFSLLSRIWNSISASVLNSVLIEVTPLQMRSNCYKKHTIMNVCCVQWFLRGLVSFTTVVWMLTMIQERPDCAVAKRLKRPKLCMRR